MKYKCRSEGLRTNRIRPKANDFPLHNVAYSHTALDSAWKMKNL